MGTNLLAIPKAHATIATGTNEDWLDTIVYHVGDVNGPQLDLRGIKFELELRRTPPDNQVILHTFPFVGSSPNIGYLIFYVEESVMEQIQADVYVGDVRGSDDAFERVILTIDFTLIKGVTR